MSVLLAVGLGGCADPCERLSAGVCAGGDADYCKAVDAWLATRLVDPTTKEPLAGEPRDQMCGAIYDNVEMFYAYQFKAKQKILGEPDFILASQKKAKEEAEAYEEATKKIQQGEDAEESPGGANMSD
ncbi:hypothetical protein [Nannocystis pusilla]|uniref:Lipoprotein n=1 Tax=Nannocystis pusilla TaxID=889268 RepID=A0ABS7TLL6_9BACT|nr:hypothetical protein [Nannocystis pusilla]MBZ5709091.1 hypothetical protein [Nannocystis pusilla]